MSVALSWLERKSEDKKEKEREKKKARDSGQESS